jgi:hypothetical protein
VEGNSTYSTYEEHRTTENAFVVVVEPSTHVRDASQMARMLWGAAAAAGLRGGVMVRGCRAANTLRCYAQGGRARFHGHARAGVCGLMTSARVTKLH